SPTMCQWFVARALSPVRLRFSQVLLCHYMDDILIAAATNKELKADTETAFQTINKHGLMMAPEKKVQRMSPWKYLGWKILDQTVSPQLVRLGVDVKTLNDLQKVLGAVNWVRPLLGISNEDLHPLFNLLKGDPALNSPQRLTAEAKKALQYVAQAIGQRQANRINLTLPLMLCI
ncbi:POK18 protein, partial [Baryphthengus martii]|nr:POK18 protein [Baryphthengus martii]